MGGETEPSSLSGVLPIWIDRVENPHLSLDLLIIPVCTPDLNIAVIFCISLLPVYR